LGGYTGGGIIPILHVLLAAATIFVPIQIIQGQG
jgi:hypothetical protein